MTTQIGIHLQRGDAMRTEQKSHLYFHVLDVGREAEDDLGVVCVVSAILDFDVHVDLFFVCSDQHPGNISLKP